MTSEEREDAINFFKEVEKKEVGTYCKLAIEALEQQPCEDCISREAVLETIEDCNSDGLKGIFCSYNDGERFKEYIKDLPSATPKEKTAAWVPIDAEPHDICECNACGWLLYYEDKTDYKYCPNCGAKMDEVEE